MINNNPFSHFRLLLITALLFSVNNELIATLSPQILLSAKDPSKKPTVNNPTTTLDPMIPTVRTLSKMSITSQILDPHIAPLLTKPTNVSLTTKQSTSVLKSVFGDGILPLM
jgi:hypothetical protein